MLTATVTATCGMYEKKTFQQFIISHPPTRSHDSLESKKNSLGVEEQQQLKFTFHKKTKLLRLFMMMMMICL